ncbi:Ras family protein, partial [Ostertagia ostertagi]
SSFDTLRPLSYPDADVFVIVYSVVDPQSFAEISAHWLPEINRGNPVAQVLLVGTQVDLRWQTSKDTVSTAKGRQLASQIGAEFFECSALTQHNLKQMFDSAILAALEGRRVIKSPRPHLHTSRIKQGFHRIMNMTRKFI